MKHITVLYKILSVLLLGFIAVITLHAQAPIELNISSGDITIPGGGNTQSYVITGASTTNVVVIQSGYKGEITLRDLSITSSRSLSPNNNYGMSGVSCITVEGEYNGDNLNPKTMVELILEGNNTLTYSKANAGCAFQVNQGAQIHINSIDRNDNTKGKLTATTSGAGAAAIGAPYFNSAANNKGQGTATITDGGGSYPPNRNTTAGGNVIIGSGIVIARANQHGAGIGGGWYTYYNGIIIVYGGDVTSTSGYHAAGIGSGCPQGKGVMPHYAPNSTIIALPPASITAQGADGDLAGARNKTYMNDPNRSTITVRTEDNEKNADIYIDLSGAMANDNTKLIDLFHDLGINSYDLKKVRVGRTDATGGLFVFNGEFKDKTTFFTDASSTFPGYEGRPYMPKDVNSIIGDKSNKVEVILERLKTDISFIDSPSTPLEVGYNSTQAWNNAHRIKMSYNDNDPMTNLSFQLQSELQGGITSDFTGMKFLKSNGVTETSAPTTLNKGDVYYIVLPITVGKPIGIYSDVLLIGASWKGQSLPGYIRRIGMQRVVKNDTGKNEHIKVTASPVEFVDDANPATKTVTLTLNIDHGTTGILYDPLDVKAKYLITTEPNYDAALLANSDINTWGNLEIPAGNGQNKTTTVSFNAKARGTYYIHWYVESGVVYAHSQDVIKPQHTYGGFGPYILAEAVKGGRLSGNPYVCSGQTPSEIKGEASTGGSGNFSYQWQVSTDGTNWNNVSVGGNAQNYTPGPLSVSPTYFRRMTTDVKYGGTTASDNVFMISIVNDGLTLYWNTNAADNNWNNPANWVSESGAPLNMVPVSCSNVYIPGNALNFPSLHPDKTPIDVYGAPICNNITFAYGAELMYQHKLAYQKAFVQYNWGYYDNFTGVNHGDQPVKNSCHPASSKKRDRWYALAAPLKSMATGDFALAGYPLTWQAGFSLSHPSTGVAGGEIEVGDFGKMFSRNDMPLSETNNAIAVKVALYQNTIGCTDHCNLEGLKGIIEIPYFENETLLAYYPGHIYDRFTKESKFFYFNPQTLQLIHSPVGKMKRGDEAYRFIYEENGVAPNITVTGTPSSVPGYKQKVKKQNSTSLKVMIGNPFMASINAKQFFDVNSSKLQEAAGYQLFSSDEQTWKHHSFSAASTIPPLQAFIVTLKSDQEELLFPLEGTYALAKFASNGGSPEGGLGRSLYLKTHNSEGAAGDYSVLAMPETNSLTANVRKMIYSQGHTTPETFFFTPDSKEFNLVQTYERGMREIGIGVKGSGAKGQLSFTFENVEKFCAATGLRPVLVDNYMEVKQDLTVNSTYTFNQRQLASEEQYMDVDRFTLRLLSPDEELPELTGSDISITYNNKQLEVRANQNIKQIQVYDMLGRQVYSDASIDTSYYVKSLSLGQGVYVVKVYTENGRTKIDKIMAL